MKVLQVCARYWPYVGGVERVVKNVAEHLAEQNHQVIVYATDPSNRLPQLRMINGVTVKNFPSLAPKEDYHFPHPKMLTHLLSERGDIIHAHCVHDLPILVAYGAYKLSGKSKFVVSPYYHGRGHTKLARVLWAPYRPVMRRILKQADAIIVNSEALRTAIKAAFDPPHKISVVYDGVDVNEIQHATPIVIDQNYRILLYVGRLEKYKNVHKTIRAMKHLPKKYHFYIIGNGPFRPFLENLMQALKLQDRVHFMGFQPDSVVFQWLKTAHVFVHLSAVESFGMTCIESLAAGTPVIANDDKFGLRETISLYPEYIIACEAEKQSPSKLARLIMKTAELKPTKAHISRFSWNLIAKEIDAVYRKIL